MDEISTILDAPDSTSRLGLRDRAMLHLCFAAALRVSELVTAQVADLSLRGTASLRVHGKGRRERCLPLWKQTAADLRAWLAVRGDNPAPELFPERHRQAHEPRRVRIRPEQAGASSRRSLPRSGGSIDLATPSSAIAAPSSCFRLPATSARWRCGWGTPRWRTTEVYLRLDPTEKLEAIEAVLPPQLRRGRFKAPDALIASLLDLK